MDCHSDSVEKPEFMSTEIVNAHYEVVISDIDLSKSNYISGIYASNQGHDSNGGDDHNKGTISIKYNVNAKVTIEESMISCGGTSLNETVIPLSVLPGDEEVIFI